MRFSRRLWRRLFGRVPAHQDLAKDRFVDVATDGFVTRRRFVSAAAAILGAIASGYPSKHASALAWLRVMPAVMTPGQTVTTIKPSAAWVSAGAANSNFARAFSGYAGGVMPDVGVATRQGTGVFNTAVGLVRNVKNLTVLDGTNDTIWLTFHHADRQGFDHYLADVEGTQVSIPAFDAYGNPAQYYNPTLRIVGLPIKISSLGLNMDGDVAIRVVAFPKRGYPVACYGQYRLNSNGTIARPKFYADFAAGNNANNGLTAATAVQQASLAVKLAAQFQTTHPNTAPIAVCKGGQYLEDLNYQFPDTNSTDPTNLASLASITVSASIDIMSDGVSGAVVFSRTDVVAHDQGCNVYWALPATSWRMIGVTVDRKKIPILNTRKTATFVNCTFPHSDWATDAIQNNRAEAQGYTFAVGYDGAFQGEILCVGCTGYACAIGPGASLVGCNLEFAVDINQQSASGFDNHLGGNSLNQTRDFLATFMDERAQVISTTRDPFNGLVTAEFGLIGGYYVTSQYVANTTKTLPDGTSEPIYAPAQYWASFYSDAAGTSPIWHGASTIGLNVNYQFLDDGTIFRAHPNGPFGHYQTQIDAGWGDGGPEIVSGAGSTTTRQVGLLPTNDCSVSSRGTYIYVKTGAANTQYNPAYSATVTASSTNNYSFVNYNSLPIDTFCLIYSSKGLDGGNWFNSGGRWDGLGGLNGKQQNRPLLEAAPAGLVISSASGSGKITTAQLTQNTTALTLSCADDGTGVKLCTISGSGIPAIDKGTTISLTDGSGTVIYPTYVISATQFVVPPSTAVFSGKSFTYANNRHRMAGKARIKLISLCYLTLPVLPTDGSTAVFAVNDVQFTVTFKNTVTNSASQVQIDAGGSASATLHNLYLFMSGATTNAVFNTSTYTEVTSAGIPAIKMNATSKTGSIRYGLNVTIASYGYLVNVPFQVTGTSVVMYSPYADVSGAYQTQQAFNSAPIAASFTDHGGTAITVDRENYHQQYSASRTVTWAETQVDFQGNIISSTSSQGRATAVLAYQTAPVIFPSTIGLANGDRIKGGVFQHPDMIQYNNPQPTDGSRAIDNWIQDFNHVRGRDIQYGEDNSQQSQGPGTITSSGVDTSFTWNGTTPLTITSALTQNGTIKEPDGSTSYLWKASTAGHPYSWNGGGYGRLGTANCGNIYHKFTRYNGVSGSNQLLQLHAANSVAVVFLTNTNTAPSIISGDIFVPSAPFRRQTIINFGSDYGDATKQVVVMQDDVDPTVFRFDRVYATGTNANWLMLWQVHNYANVGNNWGTGNPGGNHGAWNGGAGHVNYFMIQNSVVVATAGQGTGYCNFQDCGFALSCCLDTTWLIMAAGFGHAGQFQLPAWADFNFSGCQFAVIANSDPSKATLNYPKTSYPVYISTYITPNNNTIGPLGVNANCEPLTGGGITQTAIGLVDGSGNPLGKPLVAANLNSTVRGTPGLAGPNGTAVAA